MHSTAHLCMTKTQMPNMKFNWPLILLIEWMIQIAALFFFLVISSATIAQFEGSSLTREGQFEVEWLSSEDTLFPVGKFAPVDGFWLDEVPWSVFELTLPADWGSAQDLVTQPDWSVIEAEDLTERQRHLLQLEKTHRDLNWRFSVVEQALIAQIQSPLLRYDTEREQYEKLEQFHFTLGAMETSGPASQQTHFERPRPGPLSMMDYP